MSLSFEHISPVSHSKVQYIITQSILNHLYKNSWINKARVEKAAENLGVKLDNEQNPLSLMPIMENKEKATNLYLDSLYTIAREMKVTIVLNPSIAESRKIDSSENIVLYHVDREQKLIRRDEKKDLEDLIKMVNSIEKKGGLMLIENVNEFSIEEQRYLNNAKDQYRNNTDKAPFTAYINHIQSERENIPAIMLFSTIINQVELQPEKILDKISDSSKNRNVEEISIAPSPEAQVLDNVQKMRNLILEKPVKTKLAH